MYTSAIHYFHIGNKFHSKIIVKVLICHITNTTLTIDVKHLTMHEYRPTKRIARYLYHLSMLFNKQYC